MSCQLFRRILAGQELNHCNIGSRKASKDVLGGSSLEREAELLRRLWILQPWEKSAAGPGSEHTAVFWQEASAASVDSSGQRC